MGALHNDLGLTDKSAASAGGCCGGSCACGSGASSAAAETTTTTSSDASMIDQNFDLTGLTCGNCVNHVTKAVAAIDGVCCVDIDLHAGKVSHLKVTSPALIDVAAIKAAVEDAGYQFA